MCYSEAQVRKKVSAQKAKNAILQKEGYRSKEDIYCMVFEDHLVSAYKSREME